MSLLPAGSTPWLLGHELRLLWRGQKSTSRWVIGTVLVVIAALLFWAGYPLGLALSRVELNLTPEQNLYVSLGLALILTLMLSQALAQTVEAFYQRRDLDLLLSSPLPAGRVLGVRCLALGLTIAAFYLYVLTPVTVSAAIFADQPRWLVLPPMFLGLALIVSVLALMIAMGLFALIGPRRTRVIAQIVAALIGAGFFLAFQLGNILGRDRAGAFYDSLREGALGSGAFDPGSPFLWPARGLLGETVPALSIFVFGALVFAVTVRALGRRFADNAAAVQGKEGARRASQAVRDFKPGAFRATFLKEMRLVRRDPALLSQVLLRLLYLLPLAFVLWRTVGEESTDLATVMPGAAALVVFMTAQATSALSWITIRAEDAPELLAVSPAEPRALRRAKQLAAVGVVAALLAIPVIGVTVASPTIGLITAAGCLLCALSSSQIVLWYGKPISRQGVNKRPPSGTFAASLIDFFISGFWAGATALAAAQMWLFAGIVAAVALLALLIARRPGKDAWFLPETS